MGKIRKCKHCQADIAANAKVCSQCGGENKKPIYMKWWFWITVAIVIIIICAVSLYNSI